MVGCAKAATAPTVHGFRRGAVRKSYSFDPTGVRASSGVGWLVGLKVSSNFPQVSQTLEGPFSAVSKPVAINQISMLLDFH